jgi:hypothetical protein
MKKTIWKSIGAVFGGFLAGTILTVAADFSMQSLGLMDMDKFKSTPTGIVLIVTLYRFIFSIAGCFIVARLAPDNPMKHAMILGWIGLGLSLLGTAFMWDQAVAWYNMAVILMAIPCAWLGGKLFMLTQLKTNPTH